MAYFPQIVASVNDHLSSAGLWPYTRVEVVAGFARRGYQPFGPTATAMHHDASAKPSPGRELEQQRNITRLHTVGHSRLKGPIANSDLSRFIPQYQRFVLSHIAAGRCNHAGAWRWEDTGGSADLFGIECSNTGTGSEEWPAVQLEIASAWSAGCLAVVGRDASRQVEHSEGAWPRGRKVDRYRLHSAAPDYGEQQRTRRIMVSGTRPDQDDDMRLYIAHAPGGTVWLCNPANQSRMHIDHPDRLAQWLALGEREILDVGSRDWLWIGSFANWDYVRVPAGAGQAGDQIVVRGGREHLAHLLGEIDSNTEPATPVEAAEQAEAQAGELTAIDQAVSGVGGVDASGGVGEVS